MQEHFRGKIIRRMLGEKEFRKFANEYDKFKAVNVYKQVFPELTPATRTALEKIRHWDF